MNPSQHEQQILDEIERGMQAEDPEFFAIFANMAGPRMHRGKSFWGAVMFVMGMGAFMFAAIIAQVMPDVGFFVSLAAFMTMFWGVSLLSHWALNQHGQPAVLRRRIIRLWDIRKDPPPPGMSPWLSTLWWCWRRAGGIDDDRV